MKFIIIFVNFKFSEVIFSRPQKSQSGPEWSKWIFLHQLSPQLVDICHLWLYLYTCCTLNLPNVETIISLSIFENLKTHFVELVRTYTIDTYKLIFQSLVISFFRLSLFIKPCKILKWYSHELLFHAGVMHAPIYLTFKQFLNEQFFVSICI